MRKLWQFDITGSERVDEDTASRDVAAASELSRAMQAMRVLQKKPQPRKRPSPDLVPRPGKKQKGPKAQQEKVAEAAAAAPGKHQDLEIAEVEEEVDGESNDASSQSDADRFSQLSPLGRRWKHRGSEVVGSYLKGSIFVGLPKPYPPYPLPYQASSLEPFFRLFPLEPWGQSLN